MSGYDMEPTRRKMIHPLGGRTFLPVLLTLIFLLSAGATAATGATLEVCPESSCGYQSIQDAVDASSDGDEILVRAGRYTGRIRLEEKRITLKSAAGPEATIINGLGEGSVVTMVNSPALLSGFTITNGRAARGGGLYVEGSSPIIANCVIRGNTAVAGEDAQFQGGGGAYFHLSTPTIRSCVITDNSVVAVEGNAHPHYGGGGLYLHSSSAAITDTKFIRNWTRILGAGSSADHGGAGMYSYRSESRLFGCTLTGNWNEGDWSRGGGITYSFSGQSYLESSSITANRSAIGAGIFNRSSSVEMRTSTVERNWARGGGGGVVGAYKSTLTIRESNIRENEGNSSGGVIVSDSSELRIFDSDISRNVASRGGGGGIVAINMSDIIVEQCTVADNSSLEAGGGIFIESGRKVHIRNSIVRSNRGGGITLRNLQVSARIEGSLVSGNRGYAGGAGGIVLRAKSPSVPASVENCVITENSGGKAGGVSLFSVNASIVHCTISGNMNRVVDERAAGGIYADQSSLFLANSIVWGNFDFSRSPSEIQRWESPSLEVTHSTVRGGFEGTGNIAADPLFLQAPLIGEDPKPDGPGDYRLRSASPAIDAGTETTGTSSDIAGEKRPQGKGFDMGAYEHSLEGEAL